MRRTVALAAVPAVAAALVLPSAAPVGAAPERAAAFPGLTVSTAVSGLDHPWDVRVLPGGRLLVDERSKGRLIVATGASKKVLTFPTSKVWRSGETGLLGLEVDPAFAKNRRVYTCQGYRNGSYRDVRVVAWRMNAAYTGVSFVKVLVKGFPTTSGRHGGCRLLITRDGAMVVGTGDAATSSHPQNLRSFGGKTLRLNRMTGAPWPKNPWPRAASTVRRYVLTYGHRNVQGLAQRADGTIWSVEQGTYRDDEVNRLVKGGNFGWRPGPGYDESVPMTNHALPGVQHGARWSSGDPTLATCGAAWVRGARWGDYNGTLAVAALKAQRVVFLRFAANGTLLWTRTPAALREHGRIRAVTTAPNGDLLVTTDNGGSSDVVLRVRPS